MEKIESKYCLEALKDSCSKSVFQEDMQTPFLQGCYACATDGHHAIAIPVSIIKNVQKELSLVTKDKPKILQLIPKVEDKDENVLLTLERITETVNAIPAVKTVGTKRIHCDECDGTGVVIYHYESSDGEDYEIEGNCPVCDGSGYTEVDDENDISYSPNASWPVDVMDKVIISANLIWLQKVLRTLNILSIRIKRINPKDGSFYCETTNGIVFIFTSLWAEEGSDIYALGENGEHEDPVRLI